MKALAAAARIVFPYGNHWFFLLACAGGNPYDGHN